MDRPSPDGKATERARPSAARELADRLAAERTGQPYLELRDGDGLQRLVILDPAVSHVTIGRAEATDLTLDWDEETSRVHAELERVAGDWALTDDGLSSNGTFVNAERIHGRRRLADGDRVRIGTTTLTFRAPTDESATPTRKSQGLPTHPSLSPAQRRVLVALCRPYKTHEPFALPATNQQIAEELVLTVDAVKKHMRSLFEKLGVHSLPANQKRVRLVERAFLAGLVSEREL